MGGPLPLLSRRQRRLSSCLLPLHRAQPRAGQYGAPRARLPLVELSANAEDKRDPRVMPHERYLALGRGPIARREAYRALCRDGLEAETMEAIRRATNGGFVLGNRRFEEAIGRHSVGASRVASLAPAQARSVGELVEPGNRGLSLFFSLSLVFFVHSRWLTNSPLR